jgi:subtilisin family serine protease
LSGLDADLPAYSLTHESVRRVALPSAWPAEMTREWAFGDATGAGVRVCIVDSGVDADHPLVNCRLERAVVVESDGEQVEVRDDDAGDVSGHGTACAGIIRAIAPDATLSSVRVLGPALRGGGEALIEGVRWAVRHGHDVVNLSLSTSKERFASALREIADDAYFRSCALFASAHNMPVTSYPWRFASVFSVGSHAGSDPLEYFYNPNPPVEFHARGVDVEIAWADHSTIRATGNSFATPTMAAIAALALSRHPGMTPFELKTVLMHAASNVEAAA